MEILRKLAGKLEIKNADERKPGPYPPGGPAWPGVHGAMGPIKDKTTYRVDFDNEKLIPQLHPSDRHAPPIVKTRLHWRKADFAIGRAGVEASER